MMANGEKVRTSVSLVRMAAAHLVSLSAIKKHEYLFAKHIALLLPGGKEDRESKDAKGWIGMTESYTFTEKDQHTELIIDIEAYPEWEEMMNRWNTGLQKLKEICERITN